MYKYFEDIAKVKERRCLIPFLDSEETGEASRERFVEAGIPEGQIIQSLNNFSDESINFHTPWFYGYLMVGDTIHLDWSDKAKKSLKFMRQYPEFWRQALPTNLSEASLVRLFFLLSRQRWGS